MLFFLLLNLKIQKQTKNINFKTNLMNTNASELVMDCLTEDTVKALGMASSKNYNDGSLRMWLCDRYDVSYHTPLHKIVHMVINELCA